MSITVEKLAGQLYVDPDVVRALAVRFGPDDGGPVSTDPADVGLLSDTLGGEIRMILDPRAERTLPQLYFQSAMDDWREEHGLTPPPAEPNHAPGQPLGPDPHG